MAKRVSAQRVKIHRQYTYESAADALGVSVQTVRSWRKDGLVVLYSQKPHLILGHDLKRFIQDRRSKTTCELASDEFLCMVCRAPKRAYGAMADYEPLTPNRGRLVALCEACQTPCGKFASLRACDDLREILSIAKHSKC